MASARVREVLTTASDPLAVLVDIANDETVDVQVRVQAATAAAPFMFPRLSASVVATAPAKAHDSTEHIVSRLMRKFERLAPPVQTIDSTAETIGAD